MQEAILFTCRFAGQPACRFHMVSIVKNILHFGRNLIIPVFRAQGSPAGQLKLHDNTKSQGHLHVTLSASKWIFWEPRPLFSETGTL